MAERSQGDLTGFCSIATPSRDEDADALTAEVGALYVDPGHWRQGVGRAMLTAALEELDRRSFRNVILWVLLENHAALAFYERFGFTIEEGVEKREERSGRPVIRLRASLKSSVSSKVWAAAHGSQGARWVRFASISSWSPLASTSSSRRR